MVAAKGGQVEIVTDRIRWKHIGDLRNIRETTDGNVITGTIGTLSVGGGRGGGQVSVVRRGTAFIQIRHKSHRVVILVMIHALSGNCLGHGIGKTSI